MSTHPDPHEWEVAERLWADAEEARTKALAALAHAMGVQRLCDRVLSAPEPWPLLTAAEWASTVVPALSASISSLGTALVAVLGGPGTGRTTLAKALLAALPAGSTLHDDGPGALVFAENAATVVVRQRDSILHTGQGVLVAFTGPLHAPLTAAYRHHLLPGHDVSPPGQSRPCRRLQLMLEAAVRDAYALAVLRTPGGCLYRRVAVPFFAAAAGAGAGA
jgi:hypothetical protein